jgi:hypothetical protein
MQRSYFATIRLCGGLLCAGVFLGLANPQPAAAYRCDTPWGTDHCYGTARWAEHPEYFGAYTDITQVEMSCRWDHRCDGFIDNEIWLTDTRSTGCQELEHSCWVETGTTLNWNYQNATLFWAYATPGTGDTFVFHPFGNADVPGTVDHFMILKDGRANATGTYQVWVYNDSHTTLYHATVSNPMTADRVTIGQELSGNRGASADVAHFTRNIWAVRPLGPENVFWYNRQTGDGLVTSRDPPFASWLVSPFNSSLEGGDFKTSCCG